MAPEWSDLPVHIQQKCIKNMSLITRMRLKMSSKRSRHLVESVAHPFPRVRFCEKESRYLLVIYTGIDKFVRFEFWPKIEGCIMHRFENNLRVCTERVLQTDPLDFSLAILKSLFSLPFAKFGSFEFEFSTVYSYFVEDVPIRNALRVLEPHLLNRRVVLMGTKNQARYFHGRDLPVSRLEVSCQCPESVLSNCEELMPSFVDERVSNFNQEDTYDQLTLVFDQIRYHTVRSPHYFFKSSDITYCCPSSDYASQKAFFDLLPGEIQNYQEGDKWLMVKKSDSRGICHLSECGVWIDRSDDEAGRLGFFRNKYDSYKNFCGLGYFCKTHSDPFELWYHRNLPRRLIDEPFWADGIRETRPCSISNQQSVHHRIENSPDKIEDCPKEFEVVELHDVVGEIYEDNEYTAKQWLNGGIIVFIFVFVFVETMLVIALVT